MTAKDLVRVSGIESQKGFRTFDYAIPMNEDGSYPHDGNAISVYYEKTSEIVSYKQLAKMALERQGNPFRNLYERAECIWAANPNYNGYQSLMYSSTQQISCLTVQLMNKNAGHAGLCVCGFCKEE